MGEHAAGAGAMQRAEATDALTASAARSSRLAVDRLPATLQPHGNLLRYYMLSSLMFGPGFIFAVFPLYMKYRTLRYDVDAEGITMRWGLLFRREISLTYTRIQDIQLTSNVVERWLGLARIQLQTASGSSSAEMTIEGVQDVEAMRDFLYTRMRGAGLTARGATAMTAAATDAEVDPAERLTNTLDAVADEVRELRRLLTERSGGG